MKDVSKIVSLLRKSVDVNVNHILRLGKLSRFEILIGTILSQRTKDANTVRACKQLFSKYRTPRQIAAADIRAIERLIKPAGFYRVKARRVKQVSKIIYEKYKGKVPDGRNELLKLPGVGAKTSAIVLVQGFQKPVIPVDVHVHRVSNRLGLVKTKNPEQSEIELNKVVPKKYWVEFNDLFVRFGQQICLSRNPRCKVCPINRYCNYYNRKSF